MKENEKQDLTDFWLAWKLTCSIRTCLDAETFRWACLKSGPQPGIDVAGLARRAEAVAELARTKVKGPFDHLLDSLISNFARSRQGRHSFFKDLTTGGFEEVELHLYGKRVLFGRPFKSYLFEHIATRPSCMSRNLFGYLKHTLRTMVERSFARECEIPQMTNGEGESEDIETPVEGKTWDAFSQSPQMRAEVGEIRKWFGEFLGEKVKEWAGRPSHWVVLYVIINGLSLNDKRLLAPAGVKKNRSLYDISDSIKEELATAVVARFSREAFDCAIREDVLCNMLEEIVREQDWHPILGKMAEEKMQKRRKTEADRAYKC